MENRFRGEKEEKKMETIKNGKREKKQELKWKLMTLPKEPKGCLQKKILTLQIRRLRLSDTPMQVKLLTRMITTEELRPLSAPLLLCSLGHLVPHRHKKNLFNLQSCTV